MARIKNIDLPKNKRIVVALTYIYGIGPTRAHDICAAANVSEDTRTDNLTVEEINSYEGTRHKKGLPVRGQRTSRNARTRKGRGKVVANKKKATK